MHWLGLIVIIVVAGVVAMILLQRIYDAQQKLAALHDDLRRNDLKLQSQLTQMEREQALSTPPPDSTEILEEEKS
jgi:hypothetical protein